VAILAKPIDVTGSAADLASPRLPAPHQVPSLKAALIAIARGLIVLVVLAAGGGAFAALLKSRPEPQRKQVAQRGVLVEVIEAKSSRKQLTVRAQGTVRPAQQVVVMPQVGGRVIWQSKELVPGGRFKRGQPLLKVDSRDYKLALEQQAVNVDRARLEVEIEAGRRKIARQEWDIIGEDANATQQDRALALRRPQMDAAKAAVEAARSAQAQARLALVRTGLSAPFNALVQTENVDLGQLVSPASQLAVLVGTDAYWVQVAVPIEQLPWLDVPGLNVGEDDGSEARVWKEVGGARVERVGKLVRLLGDLDSVGRLGRVLVEVKDPLRLKHNGTAKAAMTAPTEAEPPAKVELPFLIGSFVNVDIEGRAIQEVVELPRKALREGNQVFICGADDKLVVRQVDIVWRTRDSVLVRAGVNAGDQVIVSRVPGATPGLKLRRAPPPEPPAAGKP